MWETRDLTLTAQLTKLKGAQPGQKGDGMDWTPSGKGLRTYGKEGWDPEVSAHFLFLVPWDSSCWEKVFSRSWMKGQLWLGQLLLKGSDEPELSLWRPQTPPPHSILCAYMKKKREEGGRERREMREQGRRRGREEEEGEGRGGEGQGWWWLNPPTNFQLPIWPFSISVYSSSPLVHMYTQAYACVHHAELMPSLHREGILGYYKLGGQLPPMLSRQRWAVKDAWFLW